MKWCVCVLTSVWDHMQKHGPTASQCAQGTHWLCSLHTRSQVHHHVYRAVVSFVHPSSRTYACWQLLYLLNHPPQFVIQYLKWGLHPCVNHTLVHKSQSTVNLIIHQQMERQQGYKRALASCRTKLSSAIKWMNLEDITKLTEAKGRNTVN